MDERFIQRCYELAEQAVRKGNHPFGALIVRDGEIIAEAENTVVTGKNALFHAETNVIHQALSENPDWEMGEVTLYTSTEPCVMCSGATYWSGIGKVVYGCSTDGLKEVTEENFLVPCQQLFQGSRSLEVVGPIDEATGRKMHEDFWPKFLASE